MDAAAATAFALGVVNPSSSGIGGGGFAIVFDAKTKKVYAIDFREMAPAGLSQKSFIKDGKLDPKLSRTGGLAVGIPGEVAGLAHLHRVHGKLPWGQVVAPAYQLAAAGFEVAWFFAYATRATLTLLGRDEPLRRWLTPGGKALTMGQQVRRIRLANTLAAIARTGPSAFYRGPIAEDIVAAVRARGGVMTAADLASYKVIDRAPLVGAFDGGKLVTMPLPSSGGLGLLQMLGMFDYAAARFGVGKRDAGSSAAVHIIAETLKHSFADRARYLGDAEPASLAARGFLQPVRLERLAKRIGKRVRPLASYGSAKLRPVATPNDGGTSHLCVVDRDGNAVALTTTVNGYFGSKVVAPRSGVVLNNEIDDFSLQKGAVNMFGLVQSEANLVGPGKRPLSSMTPVLLIKNGKVAACVGGSGGPRIISNSYQVLLNSFRFGMNASEAVDAPRIHHQWKPDKLYYEKEFAKDVVQALVRRGHNAVLTRSPTAVQFIRVMPDGTRHAASDPRKAGAPAAE